MSPHQHDRKGGYDRTRPRRSRSEPPQFREPRERSHMIAAFEPPRAHIRRPRVNVVHFDTRPASDIEPSNLRSPIVLRPAVAHNRRTSSQDPLLRRVTKEDSHLRRYANAYLSPEDQPMYSTRMADRSPRIHFRNSNRSPSPEALSPNVFETFQYNLRYRNLGISTTYPRFEPGISGGSVPHVWANGQDKAKSPKWAMNTSPKYNQEYLAPTLSGRPIDQTFKYRDLGLMEFRLIRIFPEKMMAIKCEIIHANLEIPPRYVAISYAWGDIGDARRIQVDGSSIEITSSLYGALKSIRKKSESVLAWADALCINQQNKDERTQQVQLMTSIYTKANSVSVWLGPESDDSVLALELLTAVAAQSKSTEALKKMISSLSRRNQFAALVSLFERDYWKRLWVVQEIFNAKAINIWCGSIQLPWSVYMEACKVFREQKSQLDNYFPAGLSDGKRYSVSESHLPYSQVLVYQGPSSFPDLRSLAKLGHDSLLEVLRACRRKLASDPRDKVFGILGVLPKEVRVKFPPDYRISVKDVYTNVVAYLLTTTEHLDVLCEAIHFPIHTNSSNLPSWVPDWSHDPQTTALGLSYDFSASGNSKARFVFKDGRRTKLQISAIFLDTVRHCGISVGTLCGLDEFLMAFLQWRAILLDSHDPDQEINYNLQIHEAFCRTLCLDQVSYPQGQSPREWMRICYHVFGSLIRDRLPYLALDKELRSYAAMNLNILPQSRRQILRNNCCTRMNGRCFCLTEDGLMGMGSGYIASGDIIVVPLGCNTPVVLRAEGGCGEYKFVGDVYIDRYMRGRAVENWSEGRRELREYVLR